MGKRPEEGEITGYTKAEEKYWRLFADSYLFWFKHGMDFLRAANHVYECDVLNGAWVLLLAHSLEVFI